MQMKGNELLRLLKMSDAEFFQKYLDDAPLEELAEFLREFPDFLNDSPYREKAELEGLYRRIERKLEEKQDK